MTSSLPLSCGLPGMMGLLPTAAPPSRMTWARCSSVTESCHAASLKLRGFGSRAAAPGPSPAPLSPWHTTQFDLKTFLASEAGFLATAGAAAGAAGAAAAWGCSSAWPSGEPLSQADRARAPTSRAPNASDSNPATAKDRVFMSWNPSRRVSRARSSDATSDGRQGDRCQGLVSRGLTRAAIGSVVMRGLRSWLAVDERALQAGVVEDVTPVTCRGGARLLLRRVHEHGLAHHAFPCHPEDVVRVRRGDPGVLARVRLLGIFVGGERLHEHAGRGAAGGRGLQVVHHVTDRAEEGALAVGVDDLPPGRGLLTHHHAARPALGGADRLGGRGGRRGALVLVLGACRGRAQGERAGEGGEPPQEARWRGAGRGRRRWGCREMHQVTFFNVRMRLLDATG